MKGVKLPNKDDEAIKFVRGAMLAFPELYFARFVVLVEGDSNVSYFLVSPKRTVFLSIRPSLRSCRSADATSSISGDC